jgi:hypothetical protein
MLCWCGQEPWLEHPCCWWPGVPSAGLRGSECCHVALQSTGIHLGAFLQVLSVDAEAAVDRGGSPREAVSVFELAGLDQKGLLAEVLTLLATYGCEVGAGPGHGGIVRSDGTRHFQLGCPA